MNTSARQMCLFVLLCIALLVGVNVLFAQETPQTNVTIILDASGSMQALFSDGSTRIEIAKDAVIELATSLPAEDNAGLWVYGHRLPQDDPEASCLDIEQVIPLSPVNPAQFEQVVTPLNAIGYTPIARSLENAVTGTPPNAHNVIVLMSDGEESCGGDPCAVAAELLAQGFEVIINTIGVAPDANTRAQLQCIAQATGGAYYEANDAGALSEALSEASLPPPPETGFIQIVTPGGEIASQIGFEVLNPADNTSLGSRLGQGEFPPGNYTVRVNISPLLETSVVVTAGETTIITLPETGAVRLVDSEGAVTDIFPFTLYDPQTGQAVAYSSGGLAEVPAGQYNAVVNSNPVIEQTVSIAPGEIVDIPLSIGGIQIVDETGEPTGDYYYFVYDAETRELVTGTSGLANVSPGIYDVEINTVPRTETQVTVAA
ncbi:MAG: VWA domain-containing protein, partial [Anaerolineae bacterium]|nr:VWA domain-containing protein [Anaerolineae bacterium]